jgi:hypothetical protein
LTLRLLTRAEAPITAYRGYVCVDIDTFAMGQQRHQEGSGRAHLPGF